MEWEDKLLESVTRLGDLVVVVDEGAEGWRIHLTMNRFVIAPRGAPRHEAKRAAEEAIGAIVKLSDAAKDAIRGAPIGIPSPYQPPTHGPTCPCMRCRSGE